MASEFHIFKPPSPLEILLFLEVHFPPGNAYMKSEIGYKINTTNDSQNSWKLSHREKGVTRNLQVINETHFQISFMCQEIHQGKCETDILQFNSISCEHKHVSDQSMLAFCLRGHTFMVYLQTTSEIPPAFGFPIINTPHALRIP